MILASQSPRRRELLADAGFELTVAPADIDEARRYGEGPVELVCRLAAEKAEAVRGSLESAPADGLLVAADTIVWMGEEALGKPRDAADAAAMLRKLSGKTHHVSTGVCAMLLAEDASPVREARFVETSDVTFWELTEAQVEAYVSCGEPLDKAGSYGIQGAGRLLVREVRGDYSNVVGLPIARLVRELEALLGGRRDLVARSIRVGGAHA